MLNCGIDCVKINNFIKSIIIIVWCSDFVKGVGADLVCKTANNTQLIDRSLSAVMSYCQRNEECIGISRHANDTYTPGCRSLVPRKDVHWLSKYEYGCGLGILEYV